MSNGPLLCAASCTELLPAVTLTYTNKRIHTVGVIFGVSLTLIPSTIHHHCICCSCSQSWKLISGVLACLCSLRYFYIPLSLLSVTFDYCFSHFFACRFLFLPLVDMDMILKVSWWQMLCFVRVKQTWSSSGLKSTGSCLTCYQLPLTGEHLHHTDLKQHYNLCYVYVHLMTLLNYDSIFV